MDAENPKIKSFTDLIAWQEAHKLVLMVYKVTQSFPKEELFGLVMQLRRAVISVTSNLAEGFSRSSAKEKMHFYSIALGSHTEVQNQLFASRDLKFIELEEFNKIADQTVQVSKLINGLIKSTSNRYS